MTSPISEEEINSAYNDLQFAFESNDKGRNL
jgi:hypothetical protein